MNQGGTEDTSDVAFGCWFAISLAGQHAKTLLADPPSPSPDGPASSVSCMTRKRLLRRTPDQLNRIRDREKIAGQMLRGDEHLAREHTPRRKGVRHEGAA